MTNLMFDRIKRHTRREVCANRLKYRFWTPIVVTIFHLVFQALILFATTHENSLVQSAEDPTTGQALNGGIPLISQ